jgi:hypothetical protein
LEVRKDLQEISGFVFANDWDEKARRWPGASPHGHLQRNGSVPGKAPPFAFAFDEEKRSTGLIERDG